MRNPNGYGGITYLGPNRRNPFRVRITTGWEYNENTGKHKQVFTTLGYYPTRKAAMIALAKYNESPYDLDKAKITFEEIYVKWWAEKKQTIDESSVSAYSSAYKKLEPIYKTKIVDLKKNELQDVMNTCSNYSETLQGRVKTIMRGVFQYCLANDLVDKDYAQFVKISPKETKSIHKPYTADEIKILWDNLNLGIPLSYSKKDIRDVYPVDLILIMVYTGMRPGEVLKLKKENIYLDERYMIGGSKTDAGKERIIPIHEEIYPLIKARYDAAGEWLIPYKSDHPLTMNQYRERFFDPVVNRLNLDHLPHDGRHTFASCADRCKVNIIAVKRIMGHKSGDITQDVYTHKEIEELVEAVNQITFVEK